MLGPPGQAAFLAALSPTPSTAYLVDQAQEPSQTVGTYLTHAVDGTGKAVIRDGCVSGLNGPQGFTVKEKQEEPGS